MNWTIWDKSQPIPLHLLLEADPSERQIATYFDKSHVIQLVHAAKITGIVCLLPLSANQLEIMNIAVSAEHRNHGIGKQLLEKAFDYAVQNHFSEIIVKTGNSSIDQLAFYQKNGFRMQQIIPNYFVEHYPDQTIIENGIACLDQIMLTKEIKS
ncbi:GNAT family N-acetyltransferase [Listeria cossartiae subsp. cayugensis]|uniref:GNAT family N-acetyltransferase n=1 Tax=Listeria cossartiae TaxID=2838249 RepID=UPI0028809230|nr:GNAT family N-acetyltransferase [Listeria cossartiae]MDT0000427.1 GNAT family N-acetyltransferase [Listeria cossartiae subsp. cayugensis]MDT0008485.1 GNAT family N-acetyltransferase [Listeria cossartiae subsp. cayugensis]MDT0030317.1 GNAT family N-acetyltransferase [Listeria cossartiae subsp. cayugensis]MDT0038573.1 GNAT family N-acetyltransferase [Listeria cossartiae subsp. cayugensis]MDT0043924.1 GNAT family N-acetyltransferase [Listeria cossartiae subsp. cayugensis]